MQELPKFPVKATPGEPTQSSSAPESSAEVTEVAEEQAVQAAAVKPSKLARQLAKKQAVSAGRTKKAVRS